jgi:hypothetical protein
MDVDELAEAAVSALVEGPPDMAGAAIVAPVTLISNRLKASKTGARALDAVARHRKIG